MKLHYKTNIPKQERYEKQVTEMIDTLKDRYGEGFDETVHPEMVEQYVRSVIRAEEAEERIDNGSAEKTDYTTLKSERALQKDIIDRLKLTVRAIVGDTRSFKKDRPKDMVEFMLKKFAPILKDEGEK